MTAVKLFPHKLNDKVQARIFDVAAMIWPGAKLNYIGHDGMSFWFDEPGVRKVSFAMEELDG